MSDRAAIAAALLAATLGQACRTSNEFACDSNAQCIDGGIDGICQLSGWCSFPDGGCATGQRYGTHTGDGLAGLCVPDDDGTTGTSAMSTSVGATTLDTTDSTPTSTGHATSIDTTDATTSTSDGTTSPVTVSSSATDTSGGPTSATDSTGAPMCPMYVDDFEDGIIAADWILWVPEDVYETSGALQFLVTEAVDEYPGAELSGSHDLSQGWMRARLGTPPMDWAHQIFMQMSATDSPDDVIFWFIEGATLYARYDYAGDGWTSIFETPFLADEYRWLQIRGENGTIYFEAAGDNEVFATLAMFDAPFELSSVSLALSAGNYDIVGGDTVMSFEQFEVCSQ